MEEACLLSSPYQQFSRRHNETFISDDSPSVPIEPGLGKSVNGNKETMPSSYSSSFFLPGLPSAGVA